MESREREDAVEWLESYLDYFDVEWLESYNIKDIDMDINDLPLRFRAYFDKKMLYDNDQFPDPIGAARLEV